jgi:hypothetical protein
VVIAHKTENYQKLAGIPVSHVPIRTVGPELWASEHFPLAEDNFFTARGDWPMSYYIIVRCHYYGPKSGPWHLYLDETGEPLIFARRNEAIAAIDSLCLSHNEYACDVKILTEGNNEDICIERRLNSSSPNRRVLPTVMPALLSAPCYSRKNLGA